MSDLHCLIECGHAYLSALTDGEVLQPDPEAMAAADAGAAEALVSTLAAAGVTCDVVVVVDDTERAYESAFGTEAFETQKTAVAERYVSALPVRVDGFAFESDFDAALAQLRERLPRLAPSDLGDPNAWGVCTDTAEEVATIYGEHERDSPKQKVTFEDRRPRAFKTTPYTCQAYDAAITLVKTGHLDPVGGLESVLPATHVITLYNRDFYGSEPHRQSTAIQEIVRNHTDVDGAAHLETIHEPDLEQCRSFLGLDGERIRLQ
jgi:hypothetical protein